MVATRVMISIMTLLVGQMSKQPRKTFGSRFVHNFVSMGFDGNINCNRHPKTTPTFGFTKLMPTPPSKAISAVAASWLLDERAPFFVALTRTTCPSTFSEVMYDFSNVMRNVMYGNLDVIRITCDKQTLTRLTAAGCSATECQGE